MRLGTLWVMPLLVVTSAACKIDLDQGMSSDTACAQGTSSACMDATTHSDLTWIQKNIFTPQCTFSGCHNGENTKQGQIDLRDGKSFATLVNGNSVLMSGAKLVVPSDPTSRPLASCRSPTAACCFAARSSTRSSAGSRRER
jgi:hypothetical protein